ncbi:MAG TPA: PBP1A family penicillin-binding protein [Thermodesulfovibrionales bacterium]|nr:PBP1A family penicillin-binding protein [Thermodesulfovibrionales bacterium]
MSKRRRLFFFALAVILPASLCFIIWPGPDIGSGFNYAVVVHSADDGDLAELYKERRFFAPCRDIPPLVKKAFIAAEDRRFYSHFGVDLKGILRAASKDITAKAVVEGGSTITQQLAKMLIRNPERNLSRKLHEMIIALKLESKYSKEEILCAYLNLAYFGERVYGIEAASRTYFNKSVSDLSASEAALLAGLQKAPNTYSPLRNPSAARERMVMVLKKMRDLKFISGEEYTKGLSQALPARTFFRRKFAAPYFVEFIRQRLTAKYGDSLYTRGFHVYSTLDPAMQALAEQTVKNGVKEIELRTKPGIQAALVAMDLATGEIRAMVGGTDFSRSEFNRATMALRQPGSAFKPFIYATAIQSGMSCDDIILDEPISIPDPEGGLWSPRNSEGTYHGNVSVKTAFALSLNAATVRLAQKVGFERVRAMAEQCGITTNLDTHPSIALGSFEVTLLDLVEAYSTIATGWRVKPLAYPLIRDKDKKTVERVVPTSRQILPAHVVEKMRELLRATIESGIAGRARAVPRPVYGKTGTTNDNSDAWFVGFDDHLAVGVWVGRDDHTSLGVEETGSEAALPIWVQFMREVKY